MSLQSTAQQLLRNRIYSFFSIIELQFKEPFTERGPPEFLEKTFTECLNQLEQAENAEWVAWGDESTDPDRVCVMIGRKLPSGKRDAASKAAMLDLQEKGIPQSLEILYPFLASEPNIRHTQSPDWNEPMNCGEFPFQDRHCDIFIVDSPSTGSLYETINTEMLTLRDDCKWLLPNTICGRDQPWGDLKQAVLGFYPEEKDVGPNLGHKACTFVFLFFWKNPEAMARFKHPERESTGSYKQKIDSLWWKIQVVERFARIEHAGGQVSQGAFKLMDFMRGYPLIWPDAEILAHRTAQPTEEARGRGPQSCCTM